MLMLNVSRVHKNNQLKKRLYLMITQERTNLKLSNLLVSNPAEATFVHFLRVSKETIAFDTSFLRMILPKDTNKEYKLHN